MTDKIIGSWKVRAFAALWIAAAAAWVNHTTTVADAWSQAPAGLILVWVLGSFASLVLSSTGLYGWWLPLSERINQVVVRVMFSVIYFVVLPPFALFSRVSGALRRDDPETYWLDRPEPESVSELFDRMD